MDVQGFFEQNRWLIYALLLSPVLVHFVLAKKLAKPEKIASATSLKGSTPKAPKVFRKTEKTKHSNRKIACEASTKSSRKLTDISACSINIFYSTLGGSTQKFAEHVADRIRSSLQTELVEILNLDYIDLDEYFSKGNSNTVYLVLLPSYAIESSIDYFLSALQTTIDDFRIVARPLEKLRGFAVLGFGDFEQYAGDLFCYQAIAADQRLAKLGAQRIAPLGVVNVKLEKAQVYEAMEAWTDLFLQYAKEKAVVPSSATRFNATTDAFSSKTTLVDVEDMGSLLDRAKQELSLPIGTKLMVSEQSPTYRSLTKQGYSVVGSHSGVKICRWTKSALRGRGSCYKFSFYGIKSHLCMEATPSLACANKCTFCWRHGTNPVGTEWRWKVDPPEMIINGILQSHYDKLKLMRGVPGTRPERLAEASRVRHCALSLVGEPIFYPYINEFVSMLHEREISSFLVTNAQHPEALRRMGQVTQLYVSIDASTKDTLKAVDRPLFKDFWERFLTCLEILREKHQRTVYRMTLVKGFNMEHVKEYVNLVRLGLPCFVEIKGVTYCGNSDQSPLTMKNVPFYEEVVAFVKSLCEELRVLSAETGVTYEIAAEHAHSCSILLAQTKFKINGVWHTHINYDKFFRLVREKKEFGPMDYAAPTPDFAIFGNGGFNPDDERFYRKGKKNANSSAKGITA